MVQSDALRGRTESGKVNARWYLQRLKASAISRKCHLNNSYVNESDFNDTIRVVRGSTSTQGQHIPRILLRSPTRSFEIQPNIQKHVDSRSSNSIGLTSGPSLKSGSSSINKRSSVSELNCNSYQSLVTINRKDEKESLSDRRSSSNTILSGKVDMISRPPSTPVDPRCHRGYSSETTSIDRETCALLGPQLCSDCIEIQTRTNLSAERLPIDVMRQRLSALSLRPFLKDEQIYSDDDLLKMVNNQQIQIHPNSSNQINSSIITDEQYFDHLSSSLQQQSKGPTPFYFQNFKDFSRKYRSNQYPRLFLHETPSPTSSNPLFQKSSFEKFDISSKYSFMKKASTIKPNLGTNASVFISPKRSEQFYAEHRYLIDYSPPLLLQTLQQTVRNNSNPNILSNHLASSQTKTRKTIINCVQISFFSTSCSCVTSTFQSILEEVFVLTNIFR